MIITQRRRLMGEETPRFYRVSYMDVIRGYDICHPIGIHLIIRVCRRLWEWSHRYNATAFESQLAKAYCAGAKAEREATKQRADKGLEDEQSAIYRQRHPPHTDH